MDPVVALYLKWIGLGAVIAVVAYVGMTMRSELSPRVRVAAAIGIAVLIVVLGPTRSRYGTRRPSLSSQMEKAKNLSARDQAVRDAALDVLEKSKTSRDLVTGVELAREGNKLYDRGWIDDALPLYDRAYEILVANGAGNGDWRTDSHLFVFLENYIAALKSEGRSRDAGAITVKEQSLRRTHAAKLTAR